MRKKIMLAAGIAISLVTVKVLAGTLLASPGYVAPGCSWNHLGGGYYSPGVTVSVTGLYCNGAGPILVQTVVMPPSGTATCSLGSANPNLYTYSNPLVCNNYSVSTK